MIAKTSSHPFLNNGIRIVWDELTHGYIVFDGKESHDVLTHSFKHWDGAYHALVKHTLINKFNNVKNKKISRSRKIKLYTYYSLLLLRNAFL